MKKSLVIALALMLVLAFASSAMAAQALVNGSYLSTTATGAYEAGINASAPLTGFARVYGPNKFVADGTTNYPYEIYLPNEADPASYRIHSNYAKNTDACASCHATHTAVGASLLQWYSAYETCMACHDGTLGTATYNVEGGEIGQTGKPAFGGMFGIGTEGSLSNHNVTGSMEIAAAPGGSTVATKTKVDAEGNTIPLNWTIEFGCQSCHSPHGQGGNARILHPDANYAASSAAEARTVAKKYLVSTSGAVYVDDALTQEAYIIKGYPYSPVIIDGNVADQTGMKISNVSGTSIVVQADGTTPVVSGTVYVLNGVASLKVKMDIKNYLASNESVTHVYGMNFYCGACHTDYNTAAFTTEKSGKKETGVFAQAHRHQMGMDWYHDTAGLKLETTKVNPYAKGSMECLTCHVAHGTSQDYWAATLKDIPAVDTADGIAWPALANDPAYTELAGSSALKRMPNMGTCEACHAKGEGAEGYNANAGIVDYAQDDQIANGLMPKTYNYSAKTTDMTAADLGWVGSAKCLGCHEEYVKGWTATGHATSGHEASGLNSASCASCHNPGGNLMWTGVFNPTTGSGVDDGITCEACHGTGKNHILAPTSKNIFNPGTQNIKRQVIECSRCHDMYKNGDGATENVQFGNLQTTSGSAYLGAISTAAMAARANWSVAFRVYDSDPTKFANASQKNTASTHFGGAWGYADSKHFLGTSADASNPNGVVSCNTCHDMHSEKHAGALKFSYEQICASCHDASANLAQAVAMPTNSWGRHQLELNDYAHSFKFGNAVTAANITSATLTSVNLESALADTGLTDVQNQFEDQYLKAGATQTAAEKHDSLFAGNATSGRGGGVGVKLSIFNGATQLYNNYAGTFELTVVDNGAQLGVAQEGVDYIWEEATGAVEFPNVNPNATTYNTGLLCGTYTITWTSAVDPTVTATTSFTIVNNQ